MDDAFCNLNNEQIEAVKHTEGPLLILAGAGSGKTTVIINRIYYLINNLSVPPWKILAITFTNKAAGELKSRLETKLGNTARDIWALTFHSCCVRILRKNAELLGFNNNFNIYDTNDSISLIKHILKDFNLDDKVFLPKAVLSEISKAKDAQVWPNAYHARAQSICDLHMLKIAQIYDEYMIRLKKSNAMDFDDLLLYTVKLLSDFSDVRLYWQNHFDYIMIDEYQDTNHLQYLLVSLLTGYKQNICVVGDDDQSIYKFRGATIENILSFEHQFNTCRTIRLEQNYRSTGHILEAANNVIRNNTERKGKELWTSKGDGKKIELYFADNQDDEAYYVTGRILAGISSGASYNDFAVLYRMNAQSNSLEYSLKRNGIPYRIIGGTKFFDRAEIKDILSYMAVALSVDDDLRIERIINNPPRGIGATSLARAIQLSQEIKCSLFDILSHAESYDSLSRSASKMEEFASLINYLRTFSENNDCESVFDEIIEKTGYLRMLEEKNTIEDTTRAENVRELKTSIIQYRNDTGDPSLAGFLANVALFSDIDNYDKDSSAVTLMTMHSSKGLEFPIVFIVGAEEGIFPGIKCLGDEDELQEERRLCYVAITRAKQELHITCARNRMLFGRTSSNRASRFIDEIPEEHINKNLPKGYSYRDTSHIQNEFYMYSSNTSRINTINPPKLNDSCIDLPQFETGNSIMHKAFGEGIIVDIKPMGNDALLEINFSKIGTKKLMLRAASKFMEKI